MDRGRLNFAACLPACQPARLYVRIGALCYIPNHSFYNHIKEDLGNVRTFEVA